MTEEDFNCLSNTIWCTRITRVHTERRLLGNGEFYQWVNVYYSCVTIIFSILSYINNDNNTGLLTIFMSISLLAVMLYLNPQKYFSQANAFRENYTEIQKLEYELKHLTVEDTNEIRRIETQYCELMGKIDNHSSFDYYSTMSDYSSHVNWKSKWLCVRNIYYLDIIWIYFLRGMILLVPIILYFWQVKV